MQHCLIYTFFKLLLSLSLAESNIDVTNQQFYKWLYIYADKKNLIVVESRTSQNRCVKFTYQIQPRKK